MKTLPLLAAIFLSSLMTAEAAHPEKNSEGFAPLVADGKLVGMHSEGNWKVEDNGEVTLVPREGEEGWKRYHHYLWLDEPASDFVFDFEYKLDDKEGNSGFYFRIADESDPVTTGFEVQIKDSEGLADEKMGHHDLGGVIKTRGASRNMTKAPGEWNRMTVEVVGSQVKVTLNGAVVQDFDLSKEKENNKALPEKGLISIQDHGMPFTIRNLQIKSL